MPLLGGLSPGAHYKIGEALLEAGDERGIRNIEFAMEKEVHVIPSGCELFYNFLTSRKRVEEAERYRRCISDYYQEIELAQWERNNISTADDFKFHELAPEIVRELRAQLDKYSELHSAYLVQEVCRHFPQEPSYVLGVISKRAWYGGQDNARDQHLIDRMASQVTFPGFTYIIALEANYKPLRKVFERIQGSAIYRA